MNWRAFAGLAVWLSCSLTAAAGTIVTNIDDVSYWVGSGPNRAVLIIDWQDGKNAPGETAGQALAWGFRWTGATATGEDMMRAIAAADPRLFIDVMDFGGFGLVFGLAYDLDGDGGNFTFDPEQENGFASDPDDHFREGFVENGFWGYKNGQSTGALPSFADASFGFSQRTLSNGSWDAWVFSIEVDPPFTIPQVSPALAAVPEPSSAALLTLGGLLGLRRIKRHRG
jgi:hypothetical protein